MRVLDGESCEKAVPSHVKVCGVFLNMPRRIAARVLVIAGLVVPVVVGAQRQDAWAGTWTLNLSKSKYQSSHPPKSGISRLEQSGNSWNMSQDIVDAQGKTTHLQLTARFDGKDYPVEGSPELTYAFTRVNSRTYNLIAKRA